MSPSRQIVFQGEIYRLRIPYFFLALPSCLSIFLSFIFCLLRFLSLHPEFSFPVLLSCLLLFHFFIFVFFAYCPSFLFFSLPVLSFLYLLSYPSFLSYSLPFLPSFPIFSILILTNKLKSLKVLKYKYCFCIFFWFTSWMTK